MSILAIPRVSQNHTFETPRDWVSALYGGSTDMSIKQWIEFRMLPSKQSVFMKWPIGAYDDGVFEYAHAGKNQNVYFGTTPRNKNGGKGDADCVDSAFLWTDIDLKGTEWMPPLEPHLLPADEVKAACLAYYPVLLARLEELKLHPRAIVCSGHGFQVYIHCGWEKPEWIKKYNKALAVALNGDPVSVNVGRILRVPGTFNLKNPQRPLSVECWYLNRDFESETLLKGSGYGMQLLLDPFVVVADKPKPTTHTTPPTTSSAVHNTPSSSESVIDAYNAQNDIRTALERYGYTQDGDRFTRPGDGASGRDTVLMPNKKGIMCSFHHSSSDPMQDEHLHDPFDLFCFNEHGGDVKAAVRAAAAELGVKHERKQAVQRISSDFDPPTPTTSAQAQKSKKQKTPDEEEEKLNLVDYRNLFFQHTTGRYIYYEKNDSWFQYENGVYISLTDAQMRSRVDTVMQKLGFLNMKKNDINEILEKVRHEIGRTEFDAGPYHLNLSNGILDLKTLELTPPTPEYFSVAQSAVAYRADAYAHVWQEFLDEALPDENDQKTLQKYAGYSLTGDNSAQKSMLFVGEAGTGKGTVSYALEMLLGKLSCGMSMETLANDRFAMSSLVGRNLCVISELEKNFNWMQYKRIVGQDVVRIEQKHKDAYSEPINTKLLMASNVYPRLGDDATNASIMRRLIILLFNVKPSKPNPRLRDLLAAPQELSGILNWALEGLHALLASDFDFGTGNLEARAEIVESSNPVIEFAREHGKYERNSSVSIQDAYAQWCEFAERNGHHAGSRRTFSEKFLAASVHLGENILRGRSKSTSRAWEFQGVRL